VSTTVRILLAGLILATCASHGGCWDWSHPDELLRADGPPIVKQDAASDGPLDASSVDADLQPLDLPLPSETSVDTKPTPDTTTICTPPCSGQKPVCDNGACRACLTHTECANELCALDGSCPATKTISYVDDNCGSTRDGSKANPFCEVDDAVSETPHYILVRKGTYGPATIDASREVHGEPGAVIRSSSCPALTIDGVTASVAGLTIEGGVSIEGGASATLVANTIGPSTACVGVTTSGGGNVILKRNFINQNTPGGVSLLDVSYTVQNNIIAQNGNKTPTWGGVILKPKATSTFNNNTVVDNVSKIGEKDVGGVRCEGAATLVNNIFWGNTSNATKNPVNARQYGVGCTATYSLEQLPPGATPTATNITGDPKFATGSGAAYHITAGSSAKDKAIKGAAPKVDYDNEQRDSNPDIGADELIP
jgi:hypothetical protein